MFIKFYLKKILNALRKYLKLLNKIDKEILVNEYHLEIYLDKYLFSNKLYLFALIDTTESEEIMEYMIKK